MWLLGIITFYIVFINNNLLYLNCIVSKFKKKYKHKHNTAHTMKRNIGVSSSTKKEIYEIRTK